MRQPHWLIVLLLRLTDPRKTGLLKIAASHSMNQPESPADSLLTAYRTAFASSKQGFCLLEEIPTPATDPPDFRYLLTNPAFDQQAGLTQAVGQTIRQLVPQVEAPILASYQSVAQTGEPMQFETYVAALDRWITADVFRVGTFEPPRIGVLFTNITERKRREADLAFLADVGQDLARLTNIDQTMNALGQKIAAYMGLSACVFGELFGHNQAQIAELSHGWNRDDSPSLLGTYQMSEFMSLEMIQMCRSAEAIVIRDVFTDPKTNGPQYAALNIGSFVGIPFVREGEWRFLLVIYRSESHDWSPAEIDLTRELMSRIWTRLERARAEEALRLEDRRKDEFMAMLGHELRNPLGVLSNTLFYLEMTQGQDETLSYPIGVQRMSGQMKHLGRMVDDLLDVSRIRQGKIRLQRAPLELGPLVAQTAGAVQSLFGERNRSIALRLPPVPVVVNGDATRLAQVVMNLLTNAAKFTHEGGHVWISLEQQAQQAVLSVQDDGMGIPADELVAIFEVFVQGNTSLDRPHGGLGLGLAVVKQIVEGHQGQINAYSAGLGQGSTFTLKLPLLMEQQNEPQPAAEPSSVRGDAVRVLLVDDNKELVDLMGKIMQLRGYEVHLRYSGQEGIVAAEALAPDVLLVDIGMPYLDGYAVCRHIRQQAWGRHLPMIALTGFGQEADKQRSWAAGFDAHLLKPVDYNDLSEVVSQTIATKKNRSE